MTRTIHKLPQHVIAKIAAGEVIERPAYAIKELIENAIDAQADYITIQVEDAGLKKIVITDNGIGMSKEDIEECFKPHTTSKIYDEEELVCVKTLGFRGEALSSIAAISTLTIKSRQEKDLTGTLIKVHSGAPTEISPIGAPSGTTVIVEDLFSTVPARKKFLKTTTTEFRHIVEIVMHYALSYPDIRFFLSHNKRTVLDLPKHQETLDRINLLLGKEIVARLIPLKKQDSYISLEGFIGKPQITTTTQSKQFLFINGRKVTDKTLSQTAKEAYGNLLDPYSFPIFILFITISPELVDVNVHPRKEQVHVIHSASLLSIVKQAIIENLQNSTIGYEGLLSKESSYTSSYAGAMLKDEVTPWDIRKHSIHTYSMQQLHNLYILVETRNGFLLIDQHAAHERILFEQFEESFSQKKHILSVKKLKIPLQLEFTIDEASILGEYKKELEQMGFVITRIHNNVFSITSVPTLLHDRNIFNLLREIIDDLLEGKDSRDIDKKSEKMIAYIACRSAIKAGETLSHEQCKELLEKLQQTNNNATCPHGRPTKIEVSLKELHRMFKRS